MLGRKGLYLVVGFFSVLMLASFVLAEVRINEVELNPAGDDGGNEWIELYSDQKVKLENWKIESSNGRSMEFNASFNGYYVIFTSRNLLTNPNNSLKLENEKGNLIANTQSLTDNENNNKTWQYCDSDWIYLMASQREENDCFKEEENNQTTIAEEGGNLTESSASLNEGAIVLGGKTDSEVNNSIIYKSKKEYIREYALYAFTIFCIFLIIILLIEKRRLKPKEE
jgi:hypothetical protein